MSALGDFLSSHARIGLDTPIFIYLVERHPRYGSPAREVLRAINRGDVAGYSSVLTLTEALTLPRRTGDRALEDVYRRTLLAGINFTLLNTTPAIADTAADLRARHGLRTPDAIQIASALAAGCGAFLTNDARLRRVADLPVLTLDDLAS